MAELANDRKVVYRRLKRGMRPAGTQGEFATIAADIEHTTMGREIMVRKARGRFIAGKHCCESHPACRCSPIFRRRVETPVVRKQVEELCSLEELARIGKQRSEQLEEIR